MKLVRFLQTLFFHNPKHWAATSQNLPRRGAILLRATRLRRDVLDLDTVCIGTNKTA